jgi:hypothetical protein
VLVERATMPLWSPTGHLLFARDGVVFAVPFDPQAVAVRGAALPVMPAGLVDGTNVGGAAMRLSRSGSILFVPVGFYTKSVVSVGRDGSALALELPTERYHNPRVSPDGRRVLIERASRQMEVIDLARTTVTRLTPPSAYGVNYGTWTADGERVVLRLFNTPAWVAADGSGKGGPVPGGYVNNYPAAPGPDPDSVLMVRVVPGQSADIFLVSVSGAFDPRPLVASPGYDGGPSLSPDGRWLLFTSSLSGRTEVYLTPYPATGRQWQVSAGGGVHARWRRDGREIFYRTQGQFVAVPFDGSAATPTIGKAAPLFADTYDFGSGISIPNYDVTPDGRFILTRRDPGDGGLALGVNWTNDLVRILAAGGAK